MKDPQIPSAGSEPRIFLLSPVLHCVSMTALVYLRSSFGFAFLRPKSVFFAASWAFGLYAIYAWIDGGVWHNQRGVLLFGGGAVMLYWLHLAVAFAREWRMTGEHEHDSGTSHLLWTRQPREPSFQAVETMHLWVEPGVVLLLSVLLHLLNVRFLPGWLLIVALCLWSKEALNHWFRVRYSKRLRDAFDDTEEGIQTPVATNLSNEPPQVSRRSRVARPRHVSNGQP